MIWVNNLPIPPSANTMYETNVSKKWKHGKNGKYMGFVTSKRRSDELVHFQKSCQSFKNVNHKALEFIRSECLRWIKMGFVLRLDTYFAFENSRIWTKAGQPKGLDADNRRKALQDGVCSILDIDDKWIFSGIIEKVTCDSEDQEQCLIRISPIKHRTLQEIKNLRSTAAF